MFSREEETRLEEFIETVTQYFERTLDILMSGVVMEDSFTSLAHLGLQSFCQLVHKLLGVKILISLDAVAVDADGKVFCHEPSADGVNAHFL